MRIFAVPNMVRVVQLVEHRIVVPSVVGSSPISHPMLKKEIGDAGLFLFYLLKDTYFLRTPFVTRSTACPVRTSPSTVSYHGAEILTGMLSIPSGTIPLTLKHANPADSA